MSWQATAWAKRTRGHRSHGDKLVLFVLSDYADPETSNAFPSIHQIAADCEMSPRNVIRCLNALEAGEFISRVRKGNQYRQTIYRLNLLSHAASNEGDSYEDDVLSPAGEGDIRDRVNVTSATTEDDTGVTVGVQEDLKEEPHIYPDWFNVLSEVPGFRTPYGTANRWLESKGITETHAEETALALKSKWGGRGWKYNDPWAAFQNWVLRPPLASSRSGGDTLPEKRRRNEEGVSRGKPVRTIGT